MRESGAARPSQPSGKTIKQTADESVRRQVDVSDPLFVAAVRQAKIWRTGDRTLHEEYLRTAMDRLLAGQIPRAISVSIDYPGASTSWTFSFGEGELAREVQFDSSPMEELSVPEFNDDGTSRHLHLTEMQPKQIEMIANAGIDFETSATRPLVPSRKGLIRLANQSSLIFASRIDEGPRVDAWRFSFGVPWKREQTKDYFVTVPKSTPWELQYEFQNAARHEAVEGVVVKNHGGAMGRNEAQIVLDRLSKIASSYKEMNALDYQFMNNYANAHRELVNVFTQMDSEIRDEMMLLAYEEVSPLEALSKLDHRNTEQTNFGRFLVLVRFCCGYFGNLAQGDRLTDEEVVALMFAYECYWREGEDFLLGNLVDSMLRRIGPSGSWSWPPEPDFQGLESNRQRQWLAREVGKEILELATFYRHSQPGLEAFSMSKPTKPTFRDFKATRNQINAVAKSLEQ